MKFLHHPLQYRAGVKIHCPGDENDCRDTGAQQSICQPMQVNSLTGQTAQHHNLWMDETQRASIQHHGLIGRQVKAEGWRTIQDLQGGG